MAIDKAQQARWGRVGGYTTAARHDTRDITAPARAAFEARFYQSIPAELPTHERDRRAAAARKAYFAELTALSVAKRKAATAVDGRRSGSKGALDATEPTSSPV